MATKVGQECLTVDQLLVERMALSPNEIVSLLEFFLGATYQGRCSSRSLAQLRGHQSRSVNLVMEDVKQRAVTFCTGQRPFWQWYVDDSFIALPQVQIQLFHNHLNSFPWVLSRNHC